ncbi:oxidoreductase [Paenibacillus anseongense]|uniref:oxidoreductase n=1 Tax=Paenibacillus anseongense TaxID=2682845 RepID=UPI002DBBAE8B|nr:oxidoreductase [Paenibacillus anseongense]MEC0264864.1 oxidoreductase [Paenibacillus anseongense]
MATKQTPISSGFGATSTAAEVIQGIDLTGKIIVVTGGYSGIGLETVRAFHSAGAKVIVPARDINKAKAALAEMPDVLIEVMDLLHPASIDAFADRFLRHFDKLHILVNNAGVMAAPLARDERGNESQFAANHLGHFQLTVRLWPALVRAEGARVVALSSYGYIRGEVDFDDPHFEHREYHPWAAYGQAKSANALFAVALDSIGQRQGVRAFSVHPGCIATDLQRHLSQTELDAVKLFDENGKPIIDPEGADRKTPQQGAATSVWCATSPRLEGLGGVYCVNCEIAPLLPNDESMERFGVRPRAIDPVAAGRLWQLSEQLTGSKIKPE